MTTTPRARFAPSPSGRMHLGNLFAALLAWLDIRALGGEMLLRMEDLDPDRCKPAYLDQLADDLDWLGLDWDLGWQAGKVAYQQSHRTAQYEAAFETLATGAWSTPASAPEKSCWPPPPPMRRMEPECTTATAAPCLRKKKPPS